jgi:hypothetical protein
MYRELGIMGRSEEISKGLFWRRIEYKGGISMSSPKATQSEEGGVRIIAWLASPAHQEFAFLQVAHLPHLLVESHLASHRIR